MLITRTSVWSGKERTLRLDRGEDRDRRDDPGSASESGDGGDGAIAGDAGRHPRWRGFGEVRQDDTRSRADAQEGEARVKEAVAKAKSEGASRAMPKHVSAGSSSKTERAVVIDAFKSAEITRDVSGAVMVTFTAEGFDTLAAKFNLRT